MKSKASEKLENKITHVQKGVKSKCSTREKKKTK